MGDHTAAEELESTAQLFNFYSALFSPTPTPIRVDALSGPTITPLATTLRADGFIERGRFYPEASSQLSSLSHPYLVFRIDSSQGELYI